jgi:hypothetical protein
LIHITGEVGVFLGSKAVPERAKVKQSRRGRLSNSKWASSMIIKNISETVEQFTSLSMNKNNNKGFGIQITCNLS